MKVALGTWQITSTHGFWINQNPKEGEKTLSFAVKEGITSFDTAQSYGNGLTEQILGKVLSRYPNRKFEIDTKIMASSSDLNKKVNNSLTRLKIKTLNCLYLHWPQINKDNYDILKQMEELKFNGIINKIGVSNMELNTIEELFSRGIKIDSIQRPISLLWGRDFEETKAFCKENSIELVAYSPAGMGLLSGKYNSSSDLSDYRKNIFCFKDKSKEAFGELLKTIKNISFENNCTMNQVALSWTKSQEIDKVLLGARNSEQLKENLIAMKINLTKENLETLTQKAKALWITAKDEENIFSYHWN
ncbi:MAG: aldo/keto reductase [Sphaerochaetaceae bacterium]|nr:aldo/keto reductase [Sphaerochaetaceae bacterium]